MKHFIPKINTENVKGQVDTLAFCLKDLTVFVYNKSFHNYFEMFIVFINYVSVSSLAHFTSVSKC